MTHRTLRLPRRTVLKQALAGVAGLAVAPLLAACGGSGKVTVGPAATATAVPATTTGASAASSAVRSTAAATSSASHTTAAEASAVLGATPTPATVAVQTGMTPVRLWYGFGGRLLKALQEQVIDPYNKGQGAQDKIQIVVEVKDDNKWTEVLTAAKLGGNLPDTYETWLGPKILATNQFADYLPPDETAYVKQNYQPGAVESVSYQGRLWGHPTQFQPMGYIYRKSFWQQMGISGPPKTVEEEFTIAQQLTQTGQGTEQRIGLTLWQPRLAQNLDLWVARFGGQMYAFEGEHPTKIDVASPQAIDALSFLKKVVDAGVTEIKPAVAVTTAWQHGQAASGEIEVWFPLLSLHNQKITSVYDDLGAAIVPPKVGVQPVCYSYGYQLTPAKGSKHPDERLRVLQALTHKPAMPWSRFTVELVGSVPAPLNYPTPIPGWTADLTNGYLAAAKIAQNQPQDNVIGVADLRTAYGKAIKEILAGTVSVQSGLAALNSQANAILQKNNPA